VRKPEEKTVDEVRVDLKTALLLKPEARLKWLTKACKMAEEGKASTTELHSIVSSRKFAAGVHPKIGRRMAEIVLENLGIFSDKQQKHLKSDEWVLGNTFGSNQDKAGDADGDDQDRERSERSRSRDRSDEYDRKVRRASEERHEGSRRREASRRREEPTVQPTRRESDRGRDGGARDEHSGRQAREPEPEGWVEAPAAGRQEDRARREALLAEERARRKAREREDQEKWMSVEAENAKRKALEQQQAKKKQLEEEADSSLLALERMGQVSQPPPEPERDRRRDRKASRSRSIRSVSRPRSRNRRGEGRDGSYSVSVKRDRSRGRRRRRTAGPRDRAAFDEALRRRMEEREAHDTTRIPVVDPGHAQRMLGATTTAASATPAAPAATAAASAAAWSTKGYR